ncbi:MAG: RNA polymerase sigma factor [Jatrophihabitans sp.]
MIYSKLPRNVSAPPGADDVKASQHRRKRGQSARARHHEPTVVNDSRAADPADPSTPDAAASVQSASLEPDPISRANESALNRAMTGDETAFAQIYHHLQPRLHRYAMSLVGNEADDVSADAWLQIARDIRGFRGDFDAFSGWATRIVRNRAMDHLRRAARRPAEPMAEPPERPAPSDTALDAMERLSTRDAIALIASLPREQAEAVMLRAVVGLTAKQAGLVLGKSPAAVRVSAHRGLKRLAAVLEEAR